MTSTVTPFLVAQHAEVLPEVEARAGIEAGGGLVEQQDGGRVDEALGQLDAALHAAGEGFDVVLARDQ